MKTNRQAHEEAAGMGLESAFFNHIGVDPDAPAPCEKCNRRLELFGYSGVDANTGMANEDWRCPVCEIRELTEALEGARKQRDLAEADKSQLNDMLNAAKADAFKKMHLIGLREIAAKAVRELPPDVLTSPVPFSDRMDYAEAVIGRAILEAIKTVRS